MRPPPDGLVKKIAESRIGVIHSFAPKTVPGLLPDTQRSFIGYAGDAFFCRQRNAFDIYKFLVMRIF